MRLLGHLAWLAERHVPQLAAYHPEKVVQQFVKAIQNELNFMTEGHNAEHVAANFEGQDQIQIPKIYWEWTRERINVQEFVENAVLKMIIVDGLFHADPHPGNFFILPGERIAFIDFGMIGRVSEARRQEIMKLLQALLTNDAESLCAILLVWADREGDDPSELRGSVEEFLGTYAGTSMGAMDISAMVGDLLALIRENSLTMPPDQAMLLKVFVSLEGAFKKLDPDFDMMVAIQPTLNEAVIDQLSPQALGKRGLKLLTQYVELFADLPKEIRRGIYTVKTGNLKIRVELSQLDEIQRTFARGFRVLALAGITSAVLIGGAIFKALAKKPDPE